MLVLSCQTDQPTNPIVGYVCPRETLDGVRGSTRTVRATFGVRGGRGQASRRWRAWIPGTGHPNDGCDDSPPIFFGLRCRDGAFVVLQHHETKTWPSGRGTDARRPTLWESTSSLASNECLHGEGQPAANGGNCADAALANDCALLARAWKY